MCIPIIYPPNVSPANLTNPRSKSFYPTGVQIPYVYLIGWTQQKVFYVGVQHGKNANPNNLWTTYFTSSQFVKKFREEYGDPNIIQIRRTFGEGEGEKARYWESKFIQKVGAVHSGSWLNKGNGGKDFCIQGPFSPEHCQKMSDAGKRKIISLEHRQKISKANKGKKLAPCCSAETRQKMSEAKKGRIVSPETRQKMSEAKRGKRKSPLSPEHRQKLSEKVWWTNGVSEVCLTPSKSPPEGWTRGRNLLSPETRQKMSEAKKGKTHSPEHRLSISGSKKGKVCWSNGLKNIYLDPDEQPPEGWTRGKLPQSPEQCRAKSERQKGMCWWTNGLKNIYLSPDEQPPEGWVRERKLRKV